MKIKNLNPEDGFKNYSSYKIIGEASSLKNKNDQHELTLEKIYTTRRQIKLGIHSFAKTLFSGGLGLFSKNLRNDWKSFRTGKKTVLFTHTDKSLLTEWLPQRILADKGDAKAQCNLATLYAEGKGGVKKSNTKAIEYYKLSADKGNAEAQYQLAYMYSWGEKAMGSYPEAVMYYTLAAEQDHPEALYQLACIHDTTTLGTGAVAKSDIKALKYYRLAAKKDHEKAQNSVFPTCLRMAEQGDPQAQYDVGLMYAKGEGVTESKSIAFHYYKLAADNDHTKAQYNVGRIYYAKNSAKKYGVKKSTKMAFKYYKLAADKGHKNAQYNVGFMYDFGKGVDASVDNAKKYYRLAAAKDHKLAKQNLKVFAQERIDNEQERLEREKL